MGFVRSLLRPIPAVALFAVVLAGAAGAAERNVIVAATKAQPAAEPRVALVIGNADYPNAPLANPANDARAVAERLAQLRFRVTRLENASQEQMYDAIRAFGDQLRGGGVGLFYYAGHALQVRGRNYLLPARATIEREDEILYRTVDTGQILDKMESARNRVNIVILDACRNNPFGRDFRSVAPGLAVVDAPYNTLIAFATAPGAVASDGGGRNGLYTQHLLQSLADPGLSLEDVFKKVRSGVRRDSAGRQIPWESTSLEVDFYFDPLPSQTAAATAAATDPLAVEIAFWNSVKASGDPEDFRAYLKRFPDGQFAVLAGNRLRALAAPAPPPAAAPAVPPATTLAGAPAATGPTAAAPAAATLPASTGGDAAARPPASSPSGTPPATPSAQIALAAPAPTLPAPAATPPKPTPAPAPLPATSGPTTVGDPGRTPGPLRTLLGHSGEVLTVAVSRNGSQALTGAADRGLRLWDLATGKELRRFSADAAAATAAAIAADGRYFLSGGADHRVRLWDAATGAELARMDGHAAAVSAVAFGPTARYAVSAADDGEIILWELPSGRLIRRARGNDARVRSVALSGDGRTFLTASQDGLVRLWDVGDLRAVRSFGPMSAPAATAAFADSARRVGAVDTRGEVWSWDAQTATLLRRFATGSLSPALAAMAGDGETALIAGADGQIASWDVASGRALWRGAAPRSRVTALALGPRGTIGLSAGDDRRVLLWTMDR